MTERLMGYFQSRLDPQRPITTTWTLFEPIEGDAPSPDDIGRAAEKMRAVKATLRAASPPLPSGGDSMAGGNAACATLTDRQVDTLFTSTVCIFMYLLGAASALAVIYFFSLLVLLLRLLPRWWMHDKC
jgi:hypothetical protein